MGLKFGFCGVGGFARHFIPLFKEHPAVEEVVLADLNANLLAERAEKFKIKRTYPTGEELIKSDVDAIGIFVQRHLHAPLTVQALKAGKHVYSAVPMGVTLEELEEIVKLVEETGLLYMLGETSYYRPQTIFCRERFANGLFGKFVYGEGQYYHDMLHFYSHFQRSGGENWKPSASFPPMLYPTHSVSHVLSVTFARMTKVSCFGFVDDHEDGVFRKDLSLWQNDQSNQSALFRTSDGGMARINEFRRTGAGESRMSIFGTLSAYQEQTNTGVWTSLPNEDTSGAHDTGSMHSEDVSWVRDTSGVEITEENLGDLPREYLGKKYPDVSKVHPVERLPEEWLSIPSIHAGSHYFLVLDFIEALLSGKLPPNHAWIGARYNAPGIVAHESARRDGELLSIPDFGMPPVDAQYLDPRYKLKS